jgi:hypothetical protein
MVSPGTASPRTPRASASPTERAIIPESVALPPIIPVPPGAAAVSRHPLISHIMPAAQYENFLLTPLLLPSRTRESVDAIYAFPRTADNFADEGMQAGIDRIAKLDSYGTELRMLEAGAVSAHPRFARLGREIRAHQLPIQRFHDLLDAFRHDVHKIRSANFAALPDCCRRSANPIGRLLLMLQRVSGPKHLTSSDDICSGLRHRRQSTRWDWLRNLPRAQFRTER